MGIERAFLPVANRHALKARAEMKLKPEDPLCPIKYTLFQGYQVLALTQLLAGRPREIAALDKTENKKPVFSATTILCPRSRLLLGFVVNDRHSIERQKSNLAHEWGHVLQGHEPQNLLVARQEIHSKREEDEADAVGFSMLMSDEMCLAMAAMGLTDQEIAAKHQLSIQVVRMRMNRSHARRILSGAA